MTNNIFGQWFGRKATPTPPVERKGGLTHIIGRVGTVFNNLWVLATSNYPTYDNTLPDYAFWDRLRRGKAQGYEFVGLFAQGIIEIITSWVIGRSFRMELAEVDDKRQIKRVEYTNKLLQKFFLSYQQLFFDVHEDFMGLGDQFVVVNADGTPIVVPPNIVEIIYDKLDYRHVLAIRIHTQLESASIVDEYTDSVRTVTTTLGAKPAVVQTFPIRIGRIPVVHFPNDRKSNELRGRPFVEPLLPLFKEYEDTLLKGLMGAKVASNPIPVLENLENPDEVVELNQTIESPTYTDEEGNEETRKVIKFDRDTILLLGAGGRFKFAAPPPGFSRDTLNMLKLLFLIMLDKTHIPEFLWGGAIAGGGTSAEQQVPPWVRFIEGRRAKFAGTPSDPDLGIEPTGGLHELADVWLRTIALTDSRVLVGPTVVRWADLTEGDERISFEWAKWLHSRGVLTNATVLRLSGLVDNIDSELQAAQDEAADRQALMEGPTDDFAGDDERPVAADGTPDLRKESGASAPRMPAYAGGKPRSKPVK